MKKYIYHYLGHSVSVGYNSFNISSCEFTRISITSRVKICLSIILYMEFHLVSISCIGTRKFLFLILQMLLRSLSNNGKFRILITNFRNLIIEVSRYLNSAFTAKLIICAAHLL